MSDLKAKSHEKEGKKDYRGSECPFSHPFHRNPFLRLYSVLKRLLLGLLLVRFCSPVQIQSLCAESMANFFRVFQPVILYSA